MLATNQNNGLSLTVNLLNKNINKSKIDENINTQPHSPVENHVQICNLPDKLKVCCLNDDINIIKTIDAIDKDTRLDMINGNINNNHDLKTNSIEVSNCY